MPKIPLRTQEEYKPKCHHLRDQHHQVRLKRNQVRCQLWIVSSTFSLISSKIGKALIVIILDAQELVTLSTRNEWSLLSRLLYKKMKGKSSLLKLCANSKISKRSAKVGSLIQAAIKLGQLPSQTGLWAPRWVVLTEVETASSIRAVVHQRVIITIKIIRTF